MMRRVSNFSRMIALCMALVMLLALMLAGCTKGSADHTEASAVPGEPTPAPTEMAPEPVTITYMRHQTPTLEALSNEQIEAYKEIAPNVTIQYESVGTNEYDQKLNVDIAGDNAPTLYAIYDVKFETFYNNGVLAPVDPVAMGYDSVEQMLDERFMPGSMEFAVKDGQLYCGGWAESANWAIVYNKKLFDNAGVEYLSETEPLTWAEYFSIAAQLTLRDDSGQMTQMGDGIFLSAMDNPDGARYILDPIFRQLGGVAFDEITGEPLDKDRWLQVAQIMYDASLNGKYGYFDPGFPVETNAHVEMFSGRAAMVMGGVWAEGWGLSVDPELKLGFAPCPRIDADHDASTTGGWVFAVDAAADPAQQTAAWNFLEYITNDENTIKQYDDTGLFVPRKIDGYKEHLLEVTPSMKVFFDDAPRAIMTAYGDQGPERWTVFKKMAENIFKNNATPEEAVETAWQEMLNLQ